MTMLDRMRRHKGWLKWSLALVVLAFVVFYVPEFLPSSPGSRVADPRPWPTSTGRRSPSASSTRASTTACSSSARQGGNLSSDMLKQLGIDRQVLQSLIDQRAVGPKRGGSASA